MLSVIIALYVLGLLLALFGTLRPWLFTLPDERRAKHALKIDKEWKEKIEAAGEGEDRMNMESRYRDKKNELFEGSSLPLKAWVDSWMKWSTPRAETIREAQRQRRLDVPWIGSGVFVTTFASLLSLFH